MKTKRGVAFAVVSLAFVVSMACALAPAANQLSGAPGEAGKPAAVTDGGRVEKEMVKEAAPAPQSAVASAPMPQPTLAPPNDEPAEDMFFKNYGVNPSIDTEDDPLSTFALDVDTGSYTVARRYVNDGNLPPSDAVRVEEFVNYFAQDYEYPPEGQAFAIHVDSAPFPFAETERYRMMRVGIQGYAIPPEERKDASLTFVIDVSGSMNRENRLGLVKRSLELLVEQMRPTDSVGIVVYGSDSRVVLNPTSGEDQRTIMRAINALKPEGATNAEAGLRLAYEQANRAFLDDGINRVILCSDGVANVGRTGAGSIWETISGSASEGITLVTVGFGMGNYNDVLMEQLADNGDGFYAYVDTIKEAQRLFVENLTSTLQAIAMDAKVQVEFDPEVVSRYRLVGFENRAIADEDFRDDSVDAGEIGAGHRVTALYEVKLHEEAEGPIATIYMRWEDPDSHEVTEIERSFETGEMAHAFEDASPRFQLDVVVAEYAEILRESYWAQESSLGAILEEAEMVAKRLPEDQDVSEFVGLVRRAKEISGQ